MKKIAKNTRVNEGERYEEDFKKHYVSINKYKGKRKIKFLTKYKRKKQLI